MGGQPCKKKTRPPGHPATQWPALPDNFSLLPDNFSILPDRIFGGQLIFSPRQFFNILSDPITGSHLIFFSRTIFRFLPDNFSISPRQFFDFPQTKMRFSQTKSVYKFFVPASPGFFLHGCYRGIYYAKYPPPTGGGKDCR